MKTSQWFGLVLLKESSEAAGRGSELQEPEALERCCFTSIATFKTQSVPCEEQVIQQLSRPSADEGHEMW